VDGGARKDQQQRARGGRSRTAPRGRGTNAQRAPASGSSASGSAAPTAQGDDAPPPVVAPGLQRPQRPARLQYTAPSVDEPGEVQQRSDTTGSDEFSRVGRNDLCPCGSGRKYKRCHGDPRNRANA
jgi:preprotein translocase subunit SecA